MRVAVVQAAPVMMERDATIEKVAQSDAGGGGERARLVLFPEAFVPAYPRGLSFGVVVGSRTERWAAHLRALQCERRRDTERRDRCGWARRRESRASISPSA